MLQRLAPLRVRLPMTVALLLAACTGVVVTMAYRAVRASVTSATAERLRGAGDRIAALLTPGIRRSETDAQHLADTPSLRAWLTGGVALSAVPALDSVRRANPQTAAVVAIRRDGATISAGDTTAVRRAGTAPKHGIGPFFAEGRAPGYSTAAPLMVGRDTLGRLVVVRRMAAGGGGAGILAGLVGPDASFLIGNADGSLWTDFATVAPPPISPEALARLSGNERTVTGDTIAAITRVAGTPWVLWVAQPARTALAPATALVRQLSTLAIIAVILGAGIAWWAILRFTAPLDDLAKASEALAHGDYGRRMPRATRRDEAGRVAIAFNAMAEEIELHHHDLEGQVRARTTELEQAMHDLRTAQEENVRQARLATLGQLAGGVGHELRNPLGVMTNALFVLETVLPDPDQMVRDYLGILKNQISLSEKIVSDLLDFARTKPAARAPVSVESIARHQVERLGPLSRVQVEWEIPTTLPMVEVDDVQIGQVVFNLVTNAVQAMGEKGGVLRCRAYRNGNGMMVLEVIDSGAGMPDGVAGHIFEPLFTTKAKGLGLGLPVSRMLAENNGGSLWFETSLGMGTVFSLSMPVASHE